MSHMQLAIYYHHKWEVHYFSAGKIYIRNVLIELSYVIYDPSISIVFSIYFERKSFKLNVYVYDPEMFVYFLAKNHIIPPCRSLQITAAVSCILSSHSKLHSTLASDTGLSLVQSEHVTWILASHWSRGSVVKYLLQFGSQTTPNSHNNHYKRIWLDRGMWIK